MCLLLICALPFLFSCESRPAEHVVNTQQDSTRTQTDSVKTYPGLELGLELVEVIVEVIGDLD